LLEISVSSKVTTSPAFKAKIVARDVFIAGLRTRNEYVPGTRSNKRNTPSAFATTVADSAGCAIGQRDCHADNSSRCGILHNSLHDRRRPLRLPRQALSALT